MRDLLIIHVIFDHPTDYPNHWVVASQAITPGGLIRNGTFAILCESLEEARDQIPEGLYRMARFEWDDPKIFETWL